MLILPCLGSCVLPKPSGIVGEIHLRIPHKVDHDLMPTSRSWLALAKNLKCNFNIVHFLHLCLHPEVISILTTKLFGMFYTGWNFNSILMLCLLHSGLQSSDDGISPLESLPNPPDKSRLIVYASGYSIFGCLYQI